MALYKIMRLERLARFLLVGSLGKSTQVYSKVHIMPLFQKKQAHTITGHFFTRTQIMLRHLHWMPRIKQMLIIMVGQ